MRARAATPFGLAVALQLGACGLAPEEDAVELGETRAPIVGGNPTNQYAAVPLLYSEVAGQDGAQLCSGTLISPRVILTAAHCVEFRDGAPNQYVAYFGADVTGQSDPDRRAAINIIDFVFDPAWNIEDLDAGHDIGLVLLDRPAPVSPMPFNRAPLESLAGQQVHLVGWGRTTGDGEDFGIKREAMSTLQGATPLLMQYGSASANTCQGDSGGPNFMTIDGVEVVAGVTSFGNTGCDQYGFGSRVDAYATSFIDPYLAENDPDAPPPPGASDPDDDEETDGQAPDDGDDAVDAEPVSGGCAVGGRGDEGLPFGLTLAGVLGLALVARRRRAP
jgi:V8-like Glu-specific endopeptidase